MAAPAKSSFVRKTKGGAPAAPTLPDNAKISAQSGQLIISSGLADFDDLLVGGLTVGTVTLIEEDHHSQFASLLANYFLSEGFACKHNVFLASAEEDALAYAKKLPYISTARPSSASKGDTSAATATDAKEKKIEAAQQDIKIAWQYKKYLADDKDMSSSKTIGRTPPWCHSFDLNRTITPADLAAVQFDHLTLTSDATDSAVAKFKKLYTTLNKLLYKYNTEMSKSPPGKVLRISIPALASPLWGSSPQEREQAALMFLHALRGLVRPSLACCVVTVPVHTTSPSFQNRARHLVDAVFQFQAFTDSAEPPNEAFAEFDGFFVAKKLPRINSLVAVGPEHSTFGVKLKRKKLAIESIHLGPEGSRTDHKDYKQHTSKSTEPSKAARGGGEGLLCQPGPAAKDPLDF